ncbi:Lrp/AsnC family transcriptional regulator [Pantoea allii]|uniref:Lrp/AsnC family transcriptional regulator n=1 Tax=Pantoea allii TaxID=574096 RepID=UPI001560317C|nr:Lrp/AsnC family transcriptional regulator [Pantoea allii]NQS85849.1 Lrp/AsnC family transcriptional regulator [Pantoea allii]
MSLSRLDIKILQLLQQDARITNQHLADEIGLSGSPTWRKVRKLEEDDVIQVFRAVINRKKICLDVMVFVRVTIDSKSEAKTRKFEQEVMALDNVVSCYSIDDDADFFLQVVAADMDAYMDLANSVIPRLPKIKEMQNILVMKEIK